MLRLWRGVCAPELTPPLRRADWQDGPHRCGMERASGSGEAAAGGGGGHRCAEQGTAPGTAGWRRARRRGAWGAAGLRGGGSGGTPLAAVYAAAGNWVCGSCAAWRVARWRIVPYPLAGLPTRSGVFSSSLLRLCRRVCAPRALAPVTHLCNTGCQYSPHLGGMSRPSGRGEGAAGGGGRHRQERLGAVPRTAGAEAGAWGAAGLAATAAALRGGEGLQGAGGGWVLFAGCGVRVRRLTRRIGRHIFGPDQRCGARCARSCFRSPRRLRPLVSGRARLGRCVWLNAGRRSGSCD